jgi:catechol 2,3-dioxygenase-like lactoylglutathione lyase family enzyme
MPVLVWATQTQWKEARMVLSNYKVGAGLAVSDMDTAREFYEGKLGLSVSIDSADNVQYRCAEDSVLHIYLSPEHAGKSTATLASWGVEDIESRRRAHQEGRHLRALRRTGVKDRREGHRHVRG